VALAAKNGSTVEVSMPDRIPRRADAVDDPVRPLGPKAAVLQARRVKRNATAPAPIAGELISEDGAVSFVVVGGALGLLIERTQRRPLGSRLVQALVFDEVAEFRRWCDSDLVRFDYPLLHRRLWSQGHEYFARRDQQPHTL
jgi:hypothetical protein